MAELEIESRISKCFDSISDFEQKIDAKQAEVNYDDTKLTSGIKGHITKWEKKINELKEQISKDEAIVAALRLKTENTPSSGGGGSTSSSSTGMSKEVKNLKHDFSCQPMFSPPMDVSLFVRSMQMLYNSHVKHNSNLELDFVSSVESKIDTCYRIELQAYVESNGRFMTWAKMKEYLVNTHRSATTIFQELARVTSLPMRANESIKEFAIRIKQANDEAKTIIASKYKEQTSTNLTVDSLWELIGCDSIVRSMQSSSKYRHDYNEICNTIDDCVTIDKLSQKASKVADRRMNLDDTVHESQSYLSSKQHSSNNDLVAMEKRLAATFKEQMALMAKSNDPKTQPPKKENKKDKGKFWEDPTWRSKQVNKLCNNIKNDKSCSRTNCPFSPCNKSNSGKSFYTQDF